MMLSITNNIYNKFEDANFFVFVLYWYSKKFIIKTMLKALNSVWDLKNYTCIQGVSPLLNNVCIY